MNIPATNLNLPTDNIYKFIGLSGLALALASLYLFVSKVYEYRDNLVAHKEELEFISPLTQTGFAIGLLVTVIGFYFWYYRLQKPLDMDLKARLEVSLAQTRRDKEELEISKYVKIYQGLSNLETQIGSINLQIVSGAYAGSEFDTSKINNFDFSELKMHVQFYAKALVSDLNQLEELQKSHARVVAMYILNQIEGGLATSDLAKESNKIYKSISEGVRSLKEKVSELTNC